ncbi:MAG: protein-glutamate O-methyltransferase CheR, partial [bacterium]
MQQWSADGYGRLAALAHAASGLAIGPARRIEAEHRIRQAMVSAGVSDLERYRDLVASDEQALDDLISELSVGETYFFRDPHHFQFVRRTVLPEVRARAGAQHVVHAWSAGCSTGEEAYSLAIVFEQEGLALRSRILATDISRPALAGLRQARYRTWALRGVDATTRERYFTQCSAQARGAQADEYELSERIRQRVRCEYLNLSRDTYPSVQTGTTGMDVIFCRNVLIYFDADTIDAVVRRLARCLAEGGWLILGPSDPVVSDDVGLETMMTESGLFYRRASAMKARRLKRRAVAARVASMPLGVVPQAPKAPTPAPPAALISAAIDTVVAPFAAAQAALRDGDYRQAATLAAALPADADACALHAAALANFDLPAAELVCAQATARHSISVELHYLHAALLVGLGRRDAATRAAERVVYLDRTLAAGHFLLASILRAGGDRAGARRAYRNAGALCAARPG